MAHHGAVCLGKDFDETFEIIQALEKACGSKLEKAFLMYEGTAEYTKKAMLNSYIRHTGGKALPEYVSDFGSSVRDGEFFLLTFKSGASFNVKIKGCTCDSDAKLPAIAYRPHLRAGYSKASRRFRRHIRFPRPASRRDR